VNGLDGLAVTKLDVLTGHPKVKVCVAYDTPRGRTAEFPIDMLDEPTTIRPVYETLDGWTESLAEVRSKDDLPRAAREYLRFLEHETAVPLHLISVGARRARRSSSAIRSNASPERFTAHRGVRSGVALALVLLLQVAAASPRRRGRPI